MAAACALALTLGRRPLRRLPWGRTFLARRQIGVAWLDLVPALYDVLCGTRDLVGIGRASVLFADADESAPRPAAERVVRRPGALDITPALAPAASLPSLRCMWRWYLLNKHPALDRALLRERFGKRGA